MSIRRGTKVFLHCLADGTAYVSEDGAHAATAPGTPHEVAALPYEDGMELIVRAELANGVRCCTTAKVEGLAEGQVKAIVDLEAAGEGAMVVSCAPKGGLMGGSGGHAGRVTLPGDGRGTRPACPHDGGGRGTRPACPQSDDGGTPAELWVSGIKGVPSALPTGGIAFLIMQKYWYEEIECGAKSVEHRKQCKKYREMFIDHHPVAVKLQCGYTDRQIIWEIEEVEDCGEAGIDISLGKRIG